MKKIAKPVLSKDFLEEVNKEQKELDECRKESNRQTKERKKLNQKDYKTSWNHYRGVLCQTNDGYLDSFSDDLKNSIKKKLKAKNENI